MNICFKPYRDVKLFWQSDISNSSHWTFTLLPILWRSVTVCPWFVGTKPSRDPSEPGVCPVCLFCCRCCVSAVVTVLAGIESDTREVKAPDGDFITVTGIFLRSQRVCRYPQSTAVGSNSRTDSSLFTFMYSRSWHSQQVGHRVRFPRINVHLECNV